ncbi:MAG: transcriptional regulator NrdR [Christensenellaceae bacterium]|nr:transcriptional regulator NrdR [Christensenellaceae bacterium]
MKCPNCGSHDNRVVDSRTSDSNNSIRRRRECLKCNKRFTSYETIERISVLVVKKDASRQAFDAQKIKNGIIASTGKRPVSMRQIDEMVERVEQAIMNNSHDQEIQSSYIGDLVMEELRSVDEVSYVRFAAVYRQFKDISTFLDFIKGLEKKQAAK